MDATIVIPVYNEREALGEVLDQLKALTWDKGSLEILVVDDGSSDGSDQVAEEHGVRVVRHERRRGAGRARETGILHASHEVVVVTDGDGSYPVDRIPEMLELLSEADMVVGARTREAGTMRWLRVLAKEIIRGLASVLIRQPIPDLNSGLRAFRGSEVLTHRALVPPGHSWVSTITICYLMEERKVRFLPVDYYPRKGHSSFHPVLDTYSYLLTVIRTVSFFDPLRFFMPLALIFATAGVLVTLASGTVSSVAGDLFLGALITFIGGMICDQQTRSRTTLRNARISAATDTAPSDDE